MPLHLIVFSLEESKQFRFKETTEVVYRTLNVEIE